MAAGMFTMSLSAGTPPSDPDLSKKIDRSAPKTPPLQAKQPLYALAVFGKQADHHAWIVLDLEPDPAKQRKLVGRVFLDRNGDGDLNGADELLDLPETSSSFYEFPEVSLIDATGKETGYRIEIIAAAFGDETAPLHLRIFVKTPADGRFGAWGDQNSDLVFASSPENAPVIHFNGPLQMGFEVPEPFARSNQHFRLAAGVGTYGIGDGTFAYQFYKTIPDDVHPDVTVEWPAADPKYPPRPTKFILKDRC